MQLGGLRNQANHIGAGFLLTPRTHAPIYERCCAMFCDSVPAFIHERSFRAPRHVRCTEAVLLFNRRQIPEERVRKPFAVPLMHARFT